MAPIEGEGLRHSTNIQSGIRLAGAEQLAQNAAKQGSSEFAAWECRVGICVMMVSPLLFAVRPHLEIPAQFPALNVGQVWLSEFFFFAIAACNGLASELFAARRLPLVLVRISCQLSAHHPLRQQVVGILLVALQ